MADSINLQLSTGLIHNYESITTTEAVSVIAQTSRRLTSAISRASRRKMPARSRSGGGPKDQVRMSPVCTNCREKHLKCSGAPLCTRCKNGGTECIFVPSRRGKRPPKGRSETPEPQLSSSGTSQWTKILPSLSTSVIQPSSANEQRRPSYPSTIDVPPSYMHLPASNSSMSLHLIGLAYDYDLSSHPFVLPKRLVLDSLSRIEVQCLRAVIEYIGMSHDPLNQSIYGTQIERMLFSQQFTQNAYTVQAYLLLAIKLSAEHDSRAVQCLRWARDYACNIDMGRSDFPQLHSGGSQEQEDSWYSTWTVLMQLCQMWSLTELTESTPSFSHPATVSHPSSRRPSVAYESPQATRQSSTSTSGINPQVTIANPWASTQPLVPWSLSSPLRADYPDQTLVPFEQVQQPRAGIIQGQPAFSSSATANSSAGYTLPFQNIEDFLSQFPKP